MILALYPCFVLLVIGPLHAAPPAPPADLVAADHPGDTGNAVDLRWTLSPDDRPGRIPPDVLRYEILRKPANKGEFALAGEQAAGSERHTDRLESPGGRWLYQVVAVGPDEARSAPAVLETPVEPVLNWFKVSRAWFGMLLLFVCGAVVYFIEVARSGRTLKIRTIPGLEAVDEAVGRATEMGRSCLFVPGIQDINDIQTVAGLTVLSRVATVAAEYEARIEVPTARSLVMATARETVQSAFLAAGRPEAYNPDDIYYLTDEQFGFVAGVTGAMVRKRPAACFYLGAFYAESLLLAENGNAIGAIQVAGTAEVSQLPFFVAACDYTLIGEEFFAASAYLSGEPKQLGSLKGQDLGKLLGALLILVGCGLATAGMLRDDAGLARVGTYISENILGDAGL